MKTKVSIILSAVGLFAAQMTQAQGTLYLSNFAQPSIGSRAVGSDAWIAQSFITGNNLGGYNLNSIQLLMTAASGSPSGFSVSIYSRSADSFHLPENNLGSLGGPDPATGGTFGYNAAGISLAPSTSYFVVLTAATPVATGNYSWSMGNLFNASSSGGWLMEGFRFSSTDGLLWNRTGGGDFQFGVYATAVPEPTTAALAGLGLVCLSFLRHKRGW